MNWIFIGIGALLILSVLANKASEFLGIPALLFFLIIGMLAGVDGPLGLEFNNAWLAQFIGITALIFILFSGGLDTDWKTVKPVARSGIALAFFGVIFTAVLMAYASYFLGHYTFEESLLLGATVSSTDAAAVFAILRARNIRLKKDLKSVIELESASNDPIAVILTLGVIQVILVPQTSMIELLYLLMMQIVIGFIFGLIGGLLMIKILNHLKLLYKGLYPVLSVAFIIFLYGITAQFKGSGFLAVYLAGLIMGNHPFTDKSNVIPFHDALTWLMQIIMFFTLGLLVTPSEFFDLFAVDILIAIFLILIARPISVFLTLAFSSFKTNEILMISWVGLRGAVPIILATFPLIDGIPKAQTIFNHVFFIVLTSILIQGTLIPFMAKQLKVEK